MYVYIDRIWRWMTYKGWYAIKPKQPTNNEDDEFYEFEDK